MQKDGSPLRHHMEHAARRGVALAIARLTPPPYPECLAYLEGWLWEVFGRSGMGMEGLAPLSYSTVADWARLSGHRPEPQEVQALLQLDAALRHPGPEEED